MLLNAIAGLLKARNVLNMDFGAVYVTFGEPISVREYFGSILERSEHALQVSNSTFHFSFLMHLYGMQFGFEVRDSQ